MVIRVGKKREFPLVISVVKNRQFLWLLGWLKEAVLGGY